MAKVPRAGNVKTRLLPILNVEKRRSLAEAFLSDAINKANNLCDFLIIAYAPATEAHYFLQFSIETLTAVAQKGSDLGERMSNAFDFAFSDFSETNVVMIGTDSPTFPPEYIEDAFAALEESADAVLGEAADGGFYLLGLKKNYSRIYANIEWGTNGVYKQIKRNIADLKLELHNVPAWYDVDEPDDLKLLNREILANEKPQRIAPQTYRWLMENQDVFAR